MIWYAYGCKTLHYVKNWSLLLVVRGNKNYFSNQINFFLNRKNVESIGHQNLYDIGTDRPRIWKTPSHLDVKYADGWKTWELGSIVQVQMRNRKLVDFFLNEVNAPCGVFDLDNLATERIEAPLLELKPPPCTLMPVYEVCGGRSSEFANFYHYNRLM